MGIKQICSNCTGPEHCNKYCALQSGINIVNFINGIDVVETQIGELRSDGPNNKTNLIVSGHIMELGASPTYILSDLKTIIDVSGKFAQDSGISPLQALKSYLDTLDYPEDVKYEAIKTFKKVNSNKLLPVPIKPGAECEITVEDSNGKKVTSKSKVIIIKWVADKKTGKLNCTVFCTLDKSAMENTKFAKIPITEYGESIRLPQIEHSLKSSEIDRSMIQMNSLGFIKPIVVSDNNMTLAIDGQHLYRINDDKIFIIGSWKSGKIVSFQGDLEAVTKTKAYKKIHNCINYIERHRRFIVPYGMLEANKIKV